MIERKKERITGILLQLGACLALTQIIWLFLPFVRGTEVFGGQIIRTNIRGFHLLGVVAQGGILAESFLTLALNSLVIPAIVLTIVVAVLIPKAQAKGKNHLNFFCILIVILNIGYAFAVIQAPQMLFFVSQSAAANPFSLHVGAIIAFIVAAISIILYVLVYIISFVKPINYLEARLIELAALKEKGLITEFDYTECKKNILNK